MLWTSQTGWRGEEEHREKRQRNTGRLFQWSVLLEENIGRCRRMISRSRIAAQVAFSDDRAAASFQKTPPRWSQRGSGALMFQFKDPFFTYHSDHLHQLLQFARLSQNCKCSKHRLHIKERQHVSASSHCANMKPEHPGYECCHLAVVM